MGYSICIACNGPSYSLDSPCHACVNGYPSSLKCLNCNTQVVSTVRDGYSVCKCGIYLCQDCKMCPKCELDNLGSDWESNVDTADSQVEFHSFSCFQDYCDEQLEKANNDMQKAEKVYADARKKFVNLKQSTEIKLQKLSKICDNARDTFERENPNHCDNKTFGTFSCNCFDEGQVIKQFLITNK